MKKMFWMFAVAVFLATVAACGSVENATTEQKEPVADTTTPSEQQAPPYTTTLPSDAAITKGNTAVVFNANWSDPVGNLSTMTLADLSVKQALITTDGSDAMVRSFGGKIYVINRYGADTIQMIDPANFSVVANYSTGSGSNPQDIVVVSDKKAYISRLDSQNDTENTDDILIVNPLTGERLGSIDLKPYTTDDGERLARAAQMVLVNDYVYVAMQDLPGDMSKSADTNGKVAIIDTKTDTIADADADKEGVQVIELAGRNPSDITYSPDNKKLYVADSGVYVNWVIDTSDGNGGIEAIDLATNKSEGIVIDDATFGGGVAEVRLASAELGFTVVGSTVIASFNPKTYEIISKTVYTTSGYFLPDFSVDSDGKLLVCEHDFNAPGIVIVNPADGVILSGPTGVGAPPSSITFVDVE